jgi:hypothetical protein
MSGAANKSRRNGPSSKPQGQSSKEVPILKFKTDLAARPVQVRRRAETHPPHSSFELGIPFEL